VSEDRTRKAVTLRSGGQCELQVLVKEDLGRAVRWYPERCPAEAHEKSHRHGRGTGGGWSPANILDLCSLCHRWLHANPETAREGGWALLSGTDSAFAPVWLPAPFPGWWLLDPEPPDDGEHVLRLVAHGPAPAGLRRVVPASWAA
jgi:hypothetical protein